MKPVQRGIFLFFGSARSTKALIFFSIQQFLALRSREGRLWDRKQRTYAKKFFAQLEKASQGFALGETSIPAAGKKNYCTRFLSQK